jgi:hypothetical protein
MAPVRVASLAVVLMLGSAGGSMAQMVVGPAGQGGGFPGQAPPVGGFPAQIPGGFPGQGPGPSPGGMTGAFPGQGPRQGPPCMSEFMPLRTETEKRAAALKAAAQKHAPQQEICQLFIRFAESEAKVVKFMEKNASACGIPAQVITTTKGNHAKSMGTKDKVCAAAAGGGGEARRGPGLGDALGMRGVITPDSTTSGAGTLDSLSGNPLQR